MYCWKTTASDSSIEVWGSGFIGIPAFSGNQFIELNANMPSTMYHDFLVAPGTSITVGCAHRGRLGVDVMNVSIGPVGGPYTVIGTCSDDMNWKYYEFTYVIPSGQGNKFSLRFNSISTSSGDQSMGNFLDNVSVKLAGSIAVVSTGTNISCFNGTDGKIVLSTSGGTSPYTYAWSPSGGTSSSPTGLSAGTYTVLITDQNGCTNTSTVDLTQPSALSLTSAKVDVSCNGNNNGTATIIASGGTPPYTYLWNPSGSTSETVKDLTAGSYTCTVNDSAGCIQTKTVVIDEPSKLMATSSHTNVTIPKGSDGTASVIAPNGGIPPYTYAWSDPQKQTSQTAINLSAGTYTCTITDSHGCKYTITEIIVEPSLFEVEVDTVHVGCFNGTNGKISIHISNGNPPYTFDWIPTVSKDSIAYNLKAGVYVCMIKDAHQVQDTVTVIIRQPGELTAVITGKNNDCKGNNNGEATITDVKGGTFPYTYKWDINGATTSTISDLASNTYSCIITDSHGCTIERSIIITEPSGILAKVDPISVCYGNQVTLTAKEASGGNKGPYRYQWYDPIFAGNPYITTPTSTTTYTLIVFDEKGCKSEPISVTATVKEKLKVSIPSSMAICAGMTITLTPEVSGGSGNYFYEWQPKGTGSASSVTITPLATTVYTVTVRDDCSTPAVTDTVNVTVVQKPDVDFKSDFQKACGELCVNFKGIANVAGDVIEQWSWDFGDGSTSQEQNPHHCYSIPKKYTVSLYVKTSVGCDSIIFKKEYIEIYPLPVADFSFAPVNPTLENPVTFIDQSQLATQWLWDFGDDSNPDQNTSIQQNPEYIYLNTGRFCIRLIAKSDKQCEDKIKKCLYITPAMTIYVPNSFTPDGNGINDHFSVKGTYIKEFSIWIFNRWGQLIFMSSDINKGWAGDVNNNGSICQDGVYVWKLVATDYFDKKHELTGSVTLLR